MARRVFLSFVAEDLHRVDLFRGQVKAAKNDLEFSDFSVKGAYDSRNADSIRGQIRSLIRQVSVTICLIGPTTHTSRWVDWEIAESSSLGKGLLGVQLYSELQDVIPRALVDAPCEVVDWDIRAIVHAIESAARRAGFDD